MATRRQVKEGNHGHYWKILVVGATCRGYACETLMK